MTSGEDDLVLLVFRSAVGRLLALSSLEELGGVWTVWRRGLLLCGGEERGRSEGRGWKRGRSEGRGEDGRGGGVRGGEGRGWERGGEGEE